jgi:RNA polymerase primary sigma factor
MKVLRKKAVAKHKPAPRKGKAAAKRVVKASLAPIRAVKSLALMPVRKDLARKALIRKNLHAKLLAEKSRKAVPAPDIESRLHVLANPVPSPEQKIVPMPDANEEVEPAAEELAKVEQETKPVTMEEIRQAYDGDTAYQLYLKEIGQTPLLTIQQENELAARIKKGDKAAREQMIKANLRLVVKIARDYEGYGVPLLDLISEGNIGLMKGVERFDPSKGAKLSTYSAWWIKQAIKRALANQGKTIRLPVHVVDKLFHIRRAEARLQEAFGREATDDEIAEELDTTPEKIRELRTASQRPASLEAPLGYDSDNRVADVVADENAEDPYRELEDKANTGMLREVMKDLDPREVTILRYRFGLDGDDEKTLEEVGRKFGLTRERIRQIQEIALKKLRKKIEKLEAQRKAA